MAGGEKMRFYPEMEVAVVTSKATFSNDDQLLVEKLITQNFDWELLYRLSLYHKIFPRVWHHFDKSGLSAAAPSSMQGAARQFVRKNLLKSMLMWQQYIELYNSCKDVGIEIILFKGPVSAAYLYDDIALRSYGDLDILIKREDFPLVYELLLAKDYIPELQLTKKHFSAYTAIEDNLGFWNKNGLSVEIHWELSGRYLAAPLTYDFVQDDLVPTQIMKHKSVTFSDEKLLLYFVLHGTKHGWQELDHICCVSDLIEKRSRLDWQLVFNMADRYKMSRMLCIALFISESIFEQQFPRSVAGKMRADKKARQIADGIVTLFYAVDRKAGLMNEVSSDPRLSFFRFAIRDSRLDSIRYALRFLFIPTKAEWKLMKNRCIPVWGYYLIRPFRIITKALCRI